MTFVSERTGSNYRPLNLSGFLICAASIAFAVIYLQRQLGLEPCPLCTAVRLIVLLQGLVFLLVFIHNPRQIGQRIYATLGLLLAFTGIGVSARHAWLQSLPADQVPECGPGFEYLLQSFPLQEALRLILSGSGECAAVQWQLLGLTIPQLSLLLFLLLAVILVIQFRKKSQRSYFN